MIRAVNRQEIFGFLFSSHHFGAIRGPIEIGEEKPRGPSACQESDTP